MRFIPLGNNVLVKPFPPDAETEAGIVIPDSVKKKKSKCTVIAVGEETSKKIQPGMVVACIMGSGTPLDDFTTGLNDWDYLYVLKPEYILGSYEEGEFEVQPKTESSLIMSN